MQTTTNYGYNVPESGDAADVTKISENFVAIDEDLKSVADASVAASTDLGDKIDAVGVKVDEVSTKVDNIPTLLEPDFTEIKDAIAEVKTDVGNVNTAVSVVKSDTSSIKNTVDSNPLLTAGSVVKSIQRGLLNVSASNGSKHSVSISTVDINKSVILVNCSGSKTNSTWSVFCAIENVTNQEISFYIYHTGGSNTTSVKLSWQVIEFY